MTPLARLLSAGIVIDAMSDPRQRPAWTVQRLLDWTREHFRARGLESPRLCAELLLAHVLGCERIELYTRYGYVPDDRQRAELRALVRRAAAGEPIAYLIGHREFFGLDFTVTPDVLIPRPETEVLVERTIELVRQSGSSLRMILDLGTGSGCIAVALARHLPDARLCASDISHAALAVARTNAERHGVANRIELRCGDLFEPWADRLPFDVIVTNPPYISEAELPALPPTVRQYEPRESLVAGPDGLAVVRRILGGIHQALRPGGHLLCELAWNQADAARQLFEQLGGWQSLRTYRDALNHERVLHAVRVDSHPQAG